MQRLEVNATKQAILIGHSEATNILPTLDAINIINAIDFVRRILYINSIFSNVYKRINII